MNNEREYPNSFKDKRILSIYIIVIIAIFTGVTYALQSSSIAFNLTTALIGIDESAYGSLTFDSSNLEMVPILDSEVETRTNNVIKIDFTVGGAETNNAEKPIIYDIALVDLMMDCELINNQYLKWKLVKDGNQLSAGSFWYGFDTIKDNRLVLTNTQEDLPDYSSNKSGYHNYSFYIWLSDSCQDTLENCKNNGNLIDQSNILGKYFSGKIEVELNTATKKELVRTPSDTLPQNSCIQDYIRENAATYIKNLYKDGSSIISANIGGDTANPKVYLNATQGIMLDNNGDYRYYGADPNNYVSYNDELWRIISVGNVKSSETDAVGETRVKIVKADILTDDNGLNKYSWDSSNSTINSGRGVNDWSQADLMTELNTIYFNSTSGTCYTGASNATTACSFTNTGLNQKARNLTGNALYYLGGYTYSAGLYVNDVYDMERGTTVYGCSTDDGACPRITTWIGKIGLIYLSDYLYATDLSVCTIGVGYGNNENCYGKTWLYKENVTQWSLVPGTDIASLITAIYSSGNFGYGAMDYHAASSYSIIPVQYLKADVLITGGEGTSEKPYTLGIEDKKASDYIIDKYNDGNTITTVNIGGSTNNPEVHLNQTQGIMLDNNGDYRYYGADPNNYVSYNDELWRIISVGNIKSSETDTVGETRVKIVKADILTDDNGLDAYSWDSSASTVNSGYGVNDWSQADLMTELNTLYLNSGSGTCYTGSSNASTACNFTNTGLSEEARNLTADVLYYLGATRLDGLYANNYYPYERGTDVWGTSSSRICNDGACPRATTWTGRVGIIYPSDYAYATDLSVCTSEPGRYQNDENCYGKDWLLDTSNHQWTISPELTYQDRGAYHALSVYTGGNVTSYFGRYGVYNALGVRPVQYLRSEVTIVGGEGTSEKPYILGT